VNRRFIGFICFLACLISLACSNVVDRLSEARRDIHRVAPFLGMADDKCLQHTYFAWPRVSITGSVNWRKFRILGNNQVIFKVKKFIQFVVVERRRRGRVDRRGIMHYQIGNGECSL